jgi:endonuclease YncB( thermonuclease family)
LHASLKLHGVFVVVQAWPRLKLELAKPVAASFTVRVIDGDTISLEDGKPNVRPVGLNAPETGNRARYEAERQKGEVAEQRLRELLAVGGETLIKSRVPVRPARKAQMPATSVAAAALSDSMAWM